MDNFAVFEKAGQGVTGGTMSPAGVSELRKALESGYGTDVATLQGGGALRIQSLESTMLSTIQENQHFALFNELAKTNATATVDEWTEQSSVGGFLGGSTNTETGDIPQATGDYARRVGLVKFLMTRREVSYVSVVGNNIVEAEAIEAQNGALQLLTDAEFLCFEGDASVVPTEYDGIGVQIASLNDEEHIFDNEGKPLNSIHLPSKAAAMISSYGNFGRATHIFASQHVQSDFDTHLDPAYRVSLTGSPQELMLGAPVKGLSTSWGNIKMIPDIFVRDEDRQAPFELEFPSLATQNDSFQPVSVTGASATNTSSKFGAPHAGNYYYAVAGVNAQGQSHIVASAQVAVAAGKAITLTITRSASATETGYVIYRSRQNGTNGVSDFRQMARIPVAGATTTFVDLNREIPGTTKAYILNMTSGMKAITWRQFLPMTKFPLYPTSKATIPWAQLLFGYLRIGKRKHHAVIKNIVPTGASWKPFE
jgi:hypothetical protein